MDTTTQTTDDESIGELNNDDPEGAEFIFGLLKNRTSGVIQPMAPSHCCILRTIWAMASGHEDLAETYFNKNQECNNSTSEEWLRNFRIDPSVVIDFVKSTSKINKNNDILKRTAIFLSSEYNVLTKAAETGDDSLIIWLKDAGLDLTRNGLEAVGSAWTLDNSDTVILLLGLGALSNNSVADVANVTNSLGETVLHLAASRNLRILAKELLDSGAEVDQKDISSLTPFYHAVRANEKGMARLLLKRGADLFTRSENGNTLLHLAVMENSNVALSGLLELGLGITTENDEGLPPLYLAAEGGHDSMMKLMIKRGDDANSRTSSGNTLLHIAVNRGSLIAVRSLIKHGASVNWINDEGLTPLYLAANVGNPDIIWFLLNKGAARQDATSGDSLLHIAARRGDIKAIDSFVNLCIPVDQLNDKGVTPLYSAASSGNRAAVDRLLAKGADLYITLNEGRRLLHVAAVEGSVAVIESLLSVGTYVDVKDANLLTALSRAVQHDNIVSVAVLIEKGANTSFRTTDGDTLMHLAAVSNSCESIKLLIEHGLDIDAENQRNETPLYLAAKNNKTNAVDLLITLGANKNYVTSKGGSLAHLAAAANDSAALEALFDIGVDFNTIDGNGLTPLYIIIRNSKVTIANNMLEIGVDLYFINQNNDTILHIAGRNNDIKVIDYLIDRGFYTDPHGPNGLRPVDVALYAGNCGTAAHFIKKGANIRGRNGMNRTVLHSAVIGNCSRFFEEIAIYIDNIDPKDQNMQTPLHWAAILGRYEIANTLLLLGADVNSKDKFNTSPLQIAAGNSHWNIVSEFFKKDEDLNWTDANKRTLLHLATLEGKQDIVTYLTEHMRVDTYARDIKGRTPLHLAAEKGWSGIMRYLADEREPLSIECRDDEERTPLHFSAMGGHESAVQYLLSKRANPQATDCYHQTPLIYAAKHHHWSIVSMLLRDSCYGNATDETNRTVLHLAVKDAKLDIIDNCMSCLKKHINWKDSEQQTPLDLAIALENSNIIRYFIMNYGMDIKLGNCSALKIAKIGLWDVVRTLSATDMSLECRDENNRTLFHLAAWGGQKDVVLELLRNILVFIDAKDIDNRTPLHLAAIEDRYDIVRTLLDHRATKYIYDKDHMTPLSLAIHNNSWNSVRVLLEGESHVHWTDANNRTILHYAVMNGTKDIIKYLIDETKININAKDINFDTPLLLAASRGDLSNIDRQDILGSLLRKRADWKTLNKQKRNLLHLLSTIGDENSFIYVLERYALDINSKDINLQTPLHIAIINGHYNMARTLLGYRADRNVLDIHGFTPLVYAIKNRFDAVDLLDELRDVNWTDRNNRSILHLAAMNGCSGVVRKLLNPVIKKGNIDLLDINKQTPLHLAARENHNGIVNSLLQEGADGNRLDKEDHTPLNVAATSSSWEVVKTLVMRGYYKKYRYDGNRTLLHLAIMNRLRYLINHLINNKITDLAATDDLGDTPLHAAARENDPTTVKLLLNEGVEKAAVNGVGQNPLTVAMVSGSWDAVSELVNGNCDVEALDGNNRTLLHYAAMHRKKEMLDHLFSCRNVEINAMDSNNETALELLLKNWNEDLFRQYTDVNWRDERGRTILHHLMLTSHHIHRDIDIWRTFYDAVDNTCQTPLHIAIMKDKFDFIDKLLTNSISVNVADINGQSPWHLAAKHGSVSFITMVLEEQSEYYRSFNNYNHKYWKSHLRLNARDKLGRTPLQLSLDFGHQRITTLLKKYGAII